MGCTPETPSLSRAEAEAHLLSLPGWSLEFPKLRRVDVFPDFRKALAWLNRVGMLAEEQDHHPDFHLTGWSQVELVLWTHAIEGLSLSDVEMARRISELAG